MDTSEQYIKMRLAAIPDMGMGVPPYNISHFYTNEVWVDTKGDWYYTTLIDAIQLERQDQLQEMVNEIPEYPKHIINRLYDFADFVHKKPYLPKRFKDIEKDEACHFFASMEQLWLAFVMKEKYSKVWDGKNWSVVQ